MFFQGWAGIARTFAVGVLAYLALVVLLRVSGKRTLSKLNAFDLVVTVALGSTLATILLDGKVALAEGVAAVGVLVGMQWLIAALSVRSAAVRRATRSAPRLLYFKGEFEDGALRRERVTRDEIRQAVRASGRSGLAEVDAVVLESDGTLSVLSGGAVRRSEREPPGSEGPGAGAARH